MDGPDGDALAETLCAADVGLLDEDPLPFSFTPATAWSPVVVSFPHVGLEWPRALDPRPQVNFARNADFEVHTLYAEASSLGIVSVRARFSRLVVDLNRATDDVSAEVVPDHPDPRPRTSPADVPASARPGPKRRNRGVIWTNAVGNIPVLTSALPYDSFRDRIDRYYAPYHAALRQLLERRREIFGYAILLDAHSMPSSVKGDLIVGTLAGRTCSESVRESALTALRTINSDSPSWLDVRLDDPYQGGELIRQFGRPDEGIHALQLEVSRDLYMDEYRLELWEGTSRTAHPRRPLLAATRHRVVCLLRALTGVKPE